MSLVLDKSKHIILEQVRRGKVYHFGVAFDTVQKVYATTNENLKGCMEKLNFKWKNSILTVMASGDQAFNTIFYGVKNIDTFDTNLLTEYYALGIKKSAILTFNYREYLEFYRKLLSENTSFEELSSLMNKIYNNMEGKYKKYWKDILEYNYKIQKGSKNKINLFRMLLINITTIEDYQKKNNYLTNELCYNKFKNNLKNAYITFKRCECQNLPDEFKKQYDYIFLSNIPDYFYERQDYGINWDENKLTNFRNRFNRLLKKNGTLAFAYAYLFYSEISKKYHTHPIANSNVTKDDFDDYIMFDNPKSRTVKDGLLLLRKR